MMIFVLILAILIFYPLSSFLNELGTSYGYASIANFNVLAIIIIAIIVMIILMIIEILIYQVFKKAVR